MIIDADVDVFLYPDVFASCNDCLYHDDDGDDDEIKDDVEKEDEGKGESDSTFVCEFPFVIVLLAVFL